MAAVENEHIWLVMFLVNSGANMDLQDELGVTALMKAIAKGNKKIVSILVDAGADVMKQDENNFSALDYATFRKDIEIMKILLNSIEANPYCLKALVSKTVTVN